MSYVFFNDTATTEIYTLSLHDALPIYRAAAATARMVETETKVPTRTPDSAAKRSRCTDACTVPADRKSTRLNSSHANISHAVFCLKKTEARTLLHPAAARSVEPPSELP